MKLVKSRLIRKVIFRGLTEVKEKKRGRPNTSKFPSIGEFRKRKNRYGKCSAYGHYKKKCQSQTGSTKGNPPTDMPI